jgi:biopolymer transport protein ExbD
MSEVSTEGKGGKKGGKKPKTKKMSTRIDFTPMVDLGFLLITFFMLATTLIKPQTMEIAMPDKKDQAPPTKVPKSRAVTILLGKDNKLFYYLGMAENGKDPEVISTNYSPSGLRAFLLSKNGVVHNKIKALKAEKISKNIPDSLYKKMKSEDMKFKESPIVMIKATDNATYKNLVDVLDELQICNVAVFSVVDITDYDKKLMKDKDKDAF